MGKTKQYILFGALFGITLCGLITLSARGADADFQRHTEQLKQSPRSPELHYNAAWYAIEQKDDAKALKAINTALAYAPAQRGKYLYTRAWIYQQLGETEKATQDIQAAAAFNWQPDSLKERVRLALIIKRPEALETSLQQVEREMAKSLDPSVELYFWQSLLTQKLKRYDKSNQALEKLLADAPDIQDEVLAALLLQRSENHAALQNDKQAYIDIEKALALKPDTWSKDDYQRYDNQKMALHIKTDPKAASEVLAQRLAALPAEPSNENQSLHRLHIESLLNAQNTENARSTLLKVRNQYPEDPMFWGLQARYQMMVKDFKAAQIALEEALKRAKTPDQHAYLVQENLRLLALQKNVEQAKTYWQKQSQWHAHMDLWHKDFKILKAPTGFIP